MKGYVDSTGAVALGVASVVVKMIVWIRNRNEGRI